MRVWCVFSEQTRRLVARFCEGHGYFPVVSPRLFEILTTRTFGALRRNHIVSTAFETIAKKNRSKEGSLSTCGQQCIMKRQEHNRSWEWNVARKKKSRSNVNGCSTTQNDICNRTLKTPKVIYLHTGLINSQNTRSAKITVVTGFIVDSKTKDP